MTIYRGFEIKQGRSWKGLMWYVYKDGQPYTIDGDDFWATEGMAMDAVDSYLKKRAER